MTRYLFVSTPVGPLGSGAGGGVELNLTNLARQLVAQGDHVHVLAPIGSVLEGIALTTAGGMPPRYAQNQSRDTPVQVALPSVLANLWDLAYQLHTDFDVVVNWAYDWLPLYLTPFFKRPVAHVVSMGSLSNALDLALQQVVERYPGTVAMHSHAQAETFRFAREQVRQNQDPFFILPCGIDLAQYQFVPEAKGALCWIGRISPEKGLEDCAALAQSQQVPVHILGRMQDVDYWYRVRRKYPDAPLKYRGFFPTQDMQLFLGQAPALLMTPKWVEAFGVVVVEALACGVPVITYRRGGPAEIVQDGRTGFVADPDSVQGLIQSVERIPELDRHACRRSAEDLYSLEAMTAKFKLWTDQVLSQYGV